MNKQNYYDTIATRWHAITGRRGGAFKELILNDALLSAMPGIAGKTLLEIGCGNGYFMPLLLRRFSGQVPGALFRTDVSPAQLRIAEKQFPIEACRYETLDVYRSFPAALPPADLIFSSMVYNEVNAPGLQNGIRESARLLADDGLIITCVLHPLFIQKQQERGVLRKKGNVWLLPGAEGLELPVVPRSLEQYRAVFEANRLTFETREIYGNEQLYKVKPKLRELKDVPVALVVRSCKNPD